MKMFEESIKKDENVKIELEKIMKEANTNETDTSMDFQNFSEFMKSILQ